MTYYYLAASLPELSMDQAPPMSLEHFISYCEGHLCAEDLAALRGLLEGRRVSAGPGFVRDWFNLDSQLRNAIVRARAARLKEDAAPHCRPFEGYDVQIDEVVSEAFSRQSPLERERLFDELRWGLIEDLAGFDMFSSEAILSYGLKLQLVERWAALDEAEGMARLEASLTGASADEAAVAGESTGISSVA